MRFYLARHLIQGFTLIELMLVLALAGLLMTLAPPLLSAALPGLQLKGGARELAAVLRQTRSRAITQGSDVSLEVNVETHHAQITGDSHKMHIPESLELTLVTAERELRDEQHGYIRFYPDGSSTGGRITLRYNTNGYAVDVDWLTGMVRTVALSGMATR